MSDLELLPVWLSCAMAAVMTWAAVRQWLASLPQQDRRWLDRAPLLWHAAGPLMHLTSRAIAPLLPGSFSDRANRWLKRAGLDSRLTASDVYAAQLLTALVLAALFGLVVERIEVLISTPAPGDPFASGAGLIGWSSSGIVCGLLIGLFWPLAWLREQGARRSKMVARALPFYLDVVTLSVESGTHLTGALQYAVSKGPPGPLRDELDRVLRDVRTGRTRAQALRALAERLDSPAVSNWVAALVSSERQGSSLGPILRAQAEQRRQERFQQAEKLAMRAPVKMLFPLLVFIFPCTFVLLLFPVAVRLIEEGLLR